MKTLAISDKVVSIRKKKIILAFGCHPITYLNYTDHVFGDYKENLGQSKVYLQLCMCPVSNWSTKDCNSINKGRIKICSFYESVPVVAILITIIIIVTLLGIIRINSATVSLGDVSLLPHGINCIRVDFLLLLLNSCVGVNIPQ